MSTLQRLARFLVRLDYDALPEEVRRAARFQILNLLAAASHPSPEADAVARAYAHQSAGGRSHVIATGACLEPAAAATVNAASSMAHDFDDIVWMGHTCHSAVFASLAVAEHEGSSSAELITAVVAANEAAGRLGASVELGPLNGQMVTHIHAFGAAAATAKLLRLDEAQTVHALATAIAQPNFSLQPAFLASSSKLLSASVPLVTGIHAAYCAREGLTGHPRLLEDERGFWKHFSFVPLPVFFEDLGDFWVMTSLAMKDFPGCHYFQTACTALTELLRDGKSPPVGIDRIDVAVHKLAVEVDRFGAAYRDGASAQVNLNFDLRATLAILTLAGELTPRQLSEAWLGEHGEAIARLRDRIRVHHDPALTLAVLRSADAVPTGRRALASISLGQWRKLIKQYRDLYAGSLFSLREAGAWARALLAPRLKQEPGLAFPARVTVHFVDGTQATLQVDVPRGTFALPSAERVLRDKLTQAGLSIWSQGMALGTAPIAELFAALPGPGSLASVRRLGYRTLS